MSAIDDKYRSLGGSRSFLKNPVKPEMSCPDGVGHYRHYEGGSIYWSPSSGAHEVHGQIRWRWSNMGWEKSILGYPLTDELDTPDGGRYSKFQHGYIAWTPQMRDKVLLDGANQNHAANDLNLSKLTSTSVGNLKTFYENMSNWYKVDLKEAIIRRTNGTSINISGWPFVDFSKTKMINGSELGSGERFIITVAQILLMQWYMKDLKNNRPARMAQIKSYCRGCFELMLVLRKGKPRRKYSEWCSEFASYVYWRCGEAFKIHERQWYVCSSVTKHKRDDWCCRNVAYFRKEFERRRSWTPISTISHYLSYEVEAGDYIRTNKHSMLVLGVDRNKGSNNIYIVNGNVGTGKPEGSGKGVALGWKDLLTSGLVGVGKSTIYIERVG